MSIPYPDTVFLLTLKECIKQNNISNIKLFEKGNIFILKNSFWRLHFLTPLLLIALSWYTLFRPDYSVVAVILFLLTGVIFLCHLLRTHNKVTFKTNESAIVVRTFYFMQVKFYTHEIAIFELKDFRLDGMIYTNKLVCILKTGETITILDIIDDDKAEAICDVFNDLIIS